jgi:hypothetical protein
VAQPDSPTGGSEEATSGAPVRSGHVACLVSGVFGEAVVNDPRRTGQDRNPNFLSEDYEIRETCRGLERAEAELEAGADLDNP